MSRRGGHARAAEVGGAVEVAQLLKDDPANQDYAETLGGLKEASPHAPPPTHRLASHAPPGLRHRFRERQAWPLGPLRQPAWRWRGVIQLTEELLVSARLSEAAAGQPVFQHPLSALQGGGSDPDASADQALRSPAATPAARKPRWEASSALEEAQPDRIPVGTAVEAVYSEDGEWYTATVEDHTALGYVVTYDEFGNQEEVDEGNVRRRADAEAATEAEADAVAAAEREAEATKQALKRKVAQAAEREAVPKDLPPKLRINPDDSEEVFGASMQKAAKRKKAHAFKSKQRLEVLELNQNKRQNAWQQFNDGKGKSKKVGFFTGRKKESIFKSPEDPKGKVGVTGSGHGMTDFQKREKHVPVRVEGDT
eukprot:SM000114S24118  [mRNA]  locus=s114:3455:6054:- [translate_table: standard]